MATIQNNIEMALLARVGGLVLTPALPVAWPNSNFPGPSTPMPASYLRIQHFPNRNTRVHLDGADPFWRMGFLQITVVSPLNKGVSPATEIAGKVAEHFPADLVLYSGGIKVKIISAPDLAPAIDSDVSWDVPVTVYYEVSA